MERKDQSFVVICTYENSKHKDKVVYDPMLDKSLSIQKEYVIVDTFVRPLFPLVVGGIYVH